MGYKSCVHVGGQLCDACDGTVGRLPIDIHSLAKCQVQDKATRGIELLSGFQGLLGRVEANREPMGGFLRGGCFSCGANHSRSTCTYPKPNRLHRMCSYCWVPLTICGTETHESNEAGLACRHPLRGSGFQIACRLHRSGKLQGVPSKEQDFVRWMQQEDLSTGIQNCVKVYVTGLGTLYSK